ncbi:hypothetical protein [Sphingomonas sp. PB4P5]|uniref:hypothetical protein n=1 Tax=Parasphingomonas puruogangriensis TaxID=3096155 RepID=UPI002FCAAF96
MDVELEKLKGRIAALEMIVVAEKLAQALNQGKDPAVVGRQAAAFWRGIGGTLGSDTDLTFASFEESVERLSKLMEMLAKGAEEERARDTE